MPSPTVLFASIFFGAIGLGAFIYGKKMQRWKTLSLGVALMVFPYFISQTWLLYTVGCALCAGLFLFRD
jgi:drug/metabolite transporter (DMT)-like permease